MRVRAAVTGWGSFIPEKVLSNHDLEKIVDTSDEWIRTRTGISERHVVIEGETPRTMGVAAAKKALARAELDAKDLDLVICVATAFDYFLPATACLIQQDLGAERAGAFDLNAACSGFVYGISVASQFIEAGNAKRVLVVASEALTRFVNWKDRSTCVLFGDGASAVVLEATTQDAGVLSFVLGSRGDVEKMLVIEGGGCAVPASNESVANGSHFLKMRGAEVFKMAVRNMAQASRDALERANLTLDEIHAVIPHQANMRIITATQEALKIPTERLYVNVDRFGNTGAASIPIALDEYLQKNVVHIGDQFLLVAFGGGLTWGAGVLRWADVAKIQASR